MVLVRHDQVSLSGMCYGQTDIESAIAYAYSAAQVKTFIPKNVTRIVSSPLKRCALLAQALFIDYPITFNDSLKEVNFGDWELKAWDNISRERIDEWSKTPTHFQFPNGEHLSDFYFRISDFYHRIESDHDDICIVTHSGVIRVLIACMLKLSWQECLSIPVPFLSVFELNDCGYQQLCPIEAD